MSDATPPPPPAIPPPPPSASPMTLPAPTFEGHAQARGLQLNGEQQMVIGTFAAVGLLLCVVELFVGDEWLPGVFGMFLIVYALIVMAGSLPQKWLSTRVDEVLDRWVRDKTGSGYYGMVAFSVFSHAEVMGLFDSDGGLFTGWDFVEESLLQHLLGFSADSIQNFVVAMIWPFHVISEFGLLQSGVFAGACWAVFQIGRSFLPMPDFVKVEGKAKPKRRRGLLRGVLGRFRR